MRGSCPSTAFKDSFNGKDRYIPRRERSSDALKAGARMLVRSYHTEVAGRERDRDVREEETQMFVHSVVQMCRLDDKSHGNADARNRFHQLGVDERSLKQKIGAINSIYDAACENGECLQCSFFLSTRYLHHMHTPCNQWPMNETRRARSR